MKNHFVKSALTASLLSAAITAVPAQAKIAKQDDNGFLITYIAEVEASPEEIWKRLSEPKAWWDKNFSWSGSSDGFYLEPRAGGCFCEYLPAVKGKSKSSIGGSVEHMRVIQIYPNRVLRMQGALGPLQSEAVTATLTIAMQPSKKEGMSVVSFNYIVGGYMRFPAAQAAKGVDTVLGAQFVSLLRPFMKDIPSKEESSGDNPAEPNDESFTLDIDDLTDGIDDAPAPEPKPEPEYVEKGR